MEASAACGNRKSPAAASNSGNHHAVQQILQDVLKFGRLPQKIKNPETDAEVAENKLAENIDNHKLREPAQEMLEKVKTRLLLQLPFHETDDLLQFSSEYSTGFTSNIDHWDVDRWDVFTLKKINNKWFWKRVLSIPADDHWQEAPFGFALSCILGRSALEGSAYRMLRCDQRQGCHNSNWMPTRRLCEALLDATGSFYVSL